MASDWPAFDVERDSPTFALLHLASQMLGKLRVAHAPWANHGWHVTLLPVAEGLIMPAIAAGPRRFTLTLDRKPPPGKQLRALVVFIPDGGDRMAAETEL